MKISIDELRQLIFSDYEDLKNELIEVKEVMLVKEAMLKNAEKELEKYTGQAERLEFLEKENEEIKNKINVYLERLQKQDDTITILKEVRDGIQQELDDYKKDITPINLRSDENE